MSIPSIIHQIWFQGWQTLPEKFKPNVASVIDKNNNWKYMQWDDSSMRSVIGSLGKQYLDKYNSFTHIHQKIDFGRYAILYVYGGVSVDVDVVAYKNFDQTPFINSEDFIVSYNSSNAFENYIKSGRSLVMNNATILTSRANPILKKLLDHILTLSCEVGQSKESCINGTTGPKEFTTYLNNFKDQIKVLDNTYFEPCGGNDPFCEIKPHTILDHQHEGSWVSAGSRNVSKIWYWVKEYKIEILFLVLVLILLFLYRRR